MKKLSTGTPSTLKNWYNLCVVTFGADASPTKFIKNKMDKQGEDQEVLADEEYLLFMLGQMYVKEQKVKCLLENKNECDYGEASNQ